MTSLEQVQRARSFLFVPGDRPDRFDKAVAAGADVVIIDLEDAVSPEHRPTAREAVVAWLQAGGRAAVRVSAVGTADHEADVAALRLLATGPVASGEPAEAEEPAEARDEPAGGLVAVLVAKAEDPAALCALASRLSTPVVALLETAVGVLRAAEIAASDGVARLAVGHLDLAAKLGSGTSHVAMLHARSHLVLASRAAGLPGPVDGVTTALDHPDLLTDDLRHARELGMGGKLLIHPRQVGVTHVAFRPDEDEVAWAERILAAVAEQGTGAVRVDGDMVDAPVVARATDILGRKDD